MTQQRNVMRNSVLLLEAVQVECYNILLHDQLNSVERLEIGFTTLGGCMGHASK